MNLVFFKEFCVYINILYVGLREFVELTLRLEPVISKLSRKKVAAQPQWAAPLSLYYLCVLFLNALYAVLNHYTLVFLRHLLAGEVVDRSVSGLDVSLHRADGISSVGLKIEAVEA